MPLVDPVTSDTRPIRDLRAEMVSDLMAMFMVVSLLSRAGTNCLPLTLKLGGRDASGPMLIG
jgi:hypothetical protein